MLLCGVIGLGACEREPNIPTTEATLQYQAPVRAISTYLDSFHFYNGEIDEQVEAHHYVTILDDDRMQALIYDGNGDNARLIGIEYIISARLFDQLPAEEKKLWHSHRYEVKSGILLAPGLPAAEERELMNTLVSSYGKTWHTWHVHRHGDVPMGIPALMMAFTADGQLDRTLLENRDRQFNVDSVAIAAERVDLPEPDIDPLADVWEDGEIIQLERVTVDE
ncbi:MAG TPA: OBAP family protein [Enhygromyxa sp.]|nr:OBAP family protein [Enhygromyxa sp.]